MTSPEVLKQLMDEAMVLLDNDKDYPDGTNRKRAYEILKEHYSSNTENWDFLWRLGRAAYLYMRSFVLSDKSKHKELCYEANGYALAALALNNDNANVHKVCALTLGGMNDYVGTNEKIKNGHSMKNHIDEALKRTPEDRTLHHLLGRWCYNVAGLGWFEKKIASALFSATPNATYDDALKAFLEADRLGPDEAWKENELYIALTYEQLKDKVKAKEWFEHAEQIPVVTPGDEVAQTEIKAKLAKY